LDYAKNAPFDFCFFSVWSNAVFRGESNGAVEILITKKLSELEPILTAKMAEIAYWSLFPPYFGR
jgi:hypothetical protein